MIRLASILFFGLFVAANGFVPTTVGSHLRSSSTTITCVSMGLFNDMFQKPAATSKSTTKKPDKKKTAKKDDWIKNMFNPVHGGGSAKEGDLDDIYAAQQAILADRRKHFGRDKLKSKYRKVGEDHLRDIPTIAQDPKLLNQKEDDAMYLDEDHDKKTSFLPWTKKLKP